LHENATSLTSWQASHDTSTKPYRSCPHWRKASASRARASFEKRVDDHEKRITELENRGPH
jgi:hypothetical protein